MRFTRALVLATTGCVLAGAAACSRPTDPVPRPPVPDVTADAFARSLLSARDLGPGWQARPADAGLSRTDLTSFCGDETAVAIPGGPAVEVVRLTAPGATGQIRWFHQTALAYPDESTAAAAMPILRGYADACPRSTPVAAQAGGTLSAGYLELVTTSALQLGGWTGFVVLRQRRYESQHPGVTDVAVAVQARGNSVLIAEYADLDAARSAAKPGFADDWRPLVERILTRVDGSRRPAAASPAEVPASG